MRFLRPSTACFSVVSALLISAPVLAPAAAVATSSAATTETRIGYIVSRSTDTLHVVQIVRETALLGARGSQPTVKALDTVGGFKDPVDVGSGDGVAVVADFKRKEIVRIDATTLQKTGTLKTGKATRAVAITPDGTTALVLVKKKNLLVVDVTTMTLIRKLRIGKGAEDVVMDDTGAFAATVNVKSKTVSVIDVAAASARTGARRPSVVAYDLPSDCDPAAQFDVTTMGANLHVAVPCSLPVDDRRAHDGRPGDRPGIIEFFGPGPEDLDTFLVVLDGLAGMPKAVATVRGPFFPDSFTLTTVDDTGASVTHLLDNRGAKLAELGPGCTTTDPLVVLEPGSPDEPPGVLFFDADPAGRPLDPPSGSPTALSLAARSTFRVRRSRATRGRRWQSPSNAGRSHPS